MTRARPCTLLLTPELAERDPGPDLTRQMPTARMTILESPDAVGGYLAARILSQIAQARDDGRGFLLGSPTGRTPKPILAAMAATLAERSQDLSHVTIVLMDEYVVQVPHGLEYAPEDAPWSCHWFGTHEIIQRLNAVVAPQHRLADDCLWRPRLDDPEEYDRRLADAGGVDLFVLASGASDGHVAFNPPGSALDSRTRIIRLSDDTRRDNLKTFPVFGTLEAVPYHGVSAGIATLVASKACVMVALGEGKRATVERMRAASGYERDWPATLIHECARGEIVVDAAAAG
jgi:glucosamine-6-phosphate deaminase